MADVKYWRYEGASVVELARRIAEIGAEKARVEIHLRESGGPVFRVGPQGGPLPDATEALPDLNEGRPCPPFCNGA